LRILQLQRDEARLAFGRMAVGLVEAELVPIEREGARQVAYVDDREPVEEAHAVSSHLVGTSRAAPRTDNPSSRTTASGSSHHAPEGPEAGEHHAARELDRFLGNACERRADERADRDHDDERRARAGGREPDPPLRPEADDDERDLEPFEQDALESDREGVP